MSSLSFQLSFKSRHRLSQVLDQVNVRGCDWRSLVEEMGFSYEMIMLLREKASPTMALLEEWELKMGSEATLDSLMEKLNAIGNQPAVDILVSVKEQNSTKPKPVSPRGGSPYGSPRGSIAGGSSPQQSPKSSLVSSSMLGSNSVHHKTSFDSSNMLAPPPSYSNAVSFDDKHLQHRLQSLVIENQREAHGTCINDDRMKQGISNGHPIHGQQHHTNGYSIERDCRTPPNGYNHSSSGPVGRGLSEREADLAEQLRGRTLSEMDRSLLSGTEFDVFLSYAPEDFEFADEMRLRLNHRGGISVYSPSEGLMPGQSFQDEIADKIKRGCRKTIVIMSPDYIESPWCAYEARLAHHKSPDPRNHVIIPVMYRKCDVPDFIAYLFYLDFPRYKDTMGVEQYFWDRLIKSVHLKQR